MHLSSSGRLDRVDSPYLVSFAFLTCLAFLVRHTRLANLASCPLPEFVSEMFDRGQYRIGRSPSQGTKTGGLHGFPEVGQEDEILLGSLAALNPFENFTTTHRPNPAGRTFPARFVRREGHEVPRQLDHVRFHRRRRRCRHAQEWLQPRRTRHS